MPFDGLSNTDKFAFQVETRPLLVKGNQLPGTLGHELIPVDPDKHQAIVRTDNDQVLGIHGSRYKIRPYADMLENLNEAIGQAVDNTTNVEVTDSVYEGGAKMRRQIIFKDLKIQPQKDDLVAFKVDIWNSYDGSWAEQYLAWAMRLWCLNGCTTASFSVRSVIKHTNADWRQEVHVERIKRSIEMFFNSESTYQRWVSRQIQPEQADNLFRRTISHSPRPDAPNHFSRPLQTELMELYSMEPPTVWGAYNAATNWASNIGKTRGAVHNVTRARHNAVSKMLRAPEWEAIAA